MHRDNKSPKKKRKQCFSANKKAKCDSKDTTKQYDMYWLWIFEFILNLTFQFRSPYVFCVILYLYVEFVSIYSERDIVCLSKNVCICWVSKSMMRLHAPKYTYIHTNI